jgi:hypothetical protein
MKVQDSEKKLHKTTLSGLRRICLSELVLKMGVCISLLHEDGPASDFIFVL